MKLQRYKMQTLGGGTDYHPVKDEYGPWVRDYEVEKLEQERDDLLAVIELWQDEDADESRRLDKGVGNMGPAAPFYVHYSTTLRRKLRTAVSKIQSAP